MFFFHPTNHNTHTHLAPRADAEASLMDACIAENDEQLANEIGDLLLSKNLSLVHEAKGSPVFFLNLVYLLGCKNSLQRMCNRGKMKVFLGGY